MTDYATKAARATRMLKRYGTDADLIRTTASGYNPHRGTVEPAGQSTYSGTGAKFNYEQDDVDGTLVKQGDQELYLSVHCRDGTTMSQPVSGDTVSIAGSRFKVESVAKIEPTDVPLLYICQIRGT